MLRHCSWSALSRLVLQPGAYGCQRPPWWGRTSPDFEDPSQLREIDVAKATARLPGLESKSPTAGHHAVTAEQISINLQAAPLFDAFGRFVERANPFAFWAQLVQMAWLPWLAVAT
jgi:hypothetical protein